MRYAAAVAIWLMLAGGALAQEPATPPEPVVTWGGEGDFTSRYVWRGIAYSDGRVSWPSAWVAAHGFTFTFWANIDPRTSPSFNKYDLSVDYERAIGKLTLTGTHVRYGIRADTRRLTPYLSVRPHAGLSRVLDSEGRALAAAPAGTFGVAVVLGP